LQHDIEATAWPPINDPQAADPGRPKVVKLTPKRLSYVGPIAERIDHRPDLAPLVGVGTSQSARGLEAESYFPRRCDRVSRLASAQRPPHSSGVRRLRYRLLG
jgi:hypothetical protein